MNFAVNNKYDNLFINHLINRLRFEMHNTMSATQARVHFGEMMRLVTEHKEAVIVERAGKPQIAIMPVDEFERLQELRQKESWEQALQFLEAMGKKVYARRKQITVPEPEDLIHQMREGQALHE